jgi:hypothetical protein
MMYEIGSYIIGRLTPLRSPYKIGRLTPLRSPRF